MSEQFRVLLTGYGKGKGEYYIELDLGKVVNITQAEARQLFKSLPHTLAEDLSKVEAETLKDKIEAAGAKCEIEDMRFNHSNLSLM